MWSGWWSVLKTSTIITVMASTSTAVFLLRSQLPALVSNRGRHVVMNILCNFLASRGFTLPQRLFWRIAGDPVDVEGESAENSASSGRRRAPPEIQGHRICGACAPENSLKAVRRAAELGCRSVEFDVRSSKDGVLVVAHGYVAMKGQAGPTNFVVEERTWEELQMVDIGEGEQIPRFEEVLEACKREKLGMNVELKPTSTELAERVGKLLMEHWENFDDGSLMVTSFQRKPLQHLAQCCPRIALGYITNPGKPPEPDAAWLGERNHPGDCMSVCVESLTTAEVREYRKYKHMRIFTWFPGVPIFLPEEESTFDRLIRLDVDGIITNRPDRLKEFLRRRQEVEEHGGSSSSASGSSSRL